MGWLETVIAYAGSRNGLPWPLFRAQINLNKNKNKREAPIALKASHSLVTSIVTSKDALPIENRTSIR